MHIRAASSLVPTGLPAGVSESCGADSIVLESRPSRAKSRIYDAVLRLKIVRFDQKVLVIFLTLLIEGISSISLAKTLRCLIFQVASIV